MRFLFVSSNKSIVYLERTLWLYTEVVLCWRTVILFKQINSVSFCSLGCESGLYMIIKKKGWRAILNKKVFIDNFYVWSTWLKLDIIYIKSKKEKAIKPEWVMVVLLSQLLSRTRFFSTLGNLLNTGAEQL